MTRTEADADLSLRLAGLRDDIAGLVDARFLQAGARMDSMDAARQQYIAMLSDEHASIGRRIDSVRDIQDAYHAGVRLQTEERTRAADSALAAAAAALQLQLDQRLACANERLLLLQAEMDRRMETVRREAASLQAQLSQRLDSAEKANVTAAATLQIQIDQRFATEETARQVALDTATTAVHSALEAARTAVDKAELATERRFEGVNEFRQTLTDQAATFPSRDETNVRFEALSAIAGRYAESVKDLELRLTSRLDTLTAGLSGRNTERGEKRLDTAQVMQLLALVVVAAGVIISIVIKK
jgi:hypothetical protein